jgi:hypothetical protein
MISRVTGTSLIERRDLLLEQHERVAELPAARVVSLALQ